MTLFPAIVAAMLAGGSTPPSVCPETRLRQMANDHPVLTLCSSVDLIAGADSICQISLDESWGTIDSYNLQDDADPALVSTGLAWLCDRVSSLPKAKRDETLGQLEKRVAAYLVVDALEVELCVEFLASAVACTPALADLMPHDIKSRAPDPKRAGDSLASAEFAELHHRLARRLASFDPKQRAAIVESLQAEATALADEDE